MNSDFDMNWLSRVTSSLEEGGPMVDYKLVNLYAAKLLSLEESQVVRGRIFKWKTWHEAFWELKEALATDGENGENSRGEFADVIAKHASNNESTLPLPHFNEIEVLRTVVQDDVVPSDVLAEAVRASIKAKNKGEPTVVESLQWISTLTGSGILQKVAVAQETTSSVRRQGGLTPAFQLAYEAEETFAKVCLSLTTERPVQGATWLSLDHLADALQLDPEWVAGFSVYLGRLYDS